ncbi:MAG: hypothetical protein O3A56_07840 [Proteobacteria bacterium]|nr:hypothetical protein [Pseudomonadota bacterium]
MSTPKNSSRSASALPEAVIPSPNARDITAKTVRVARIHGEEKDRLAFPGRVSERRIAGDPPVHRLPLE